MKSILAILGLTCILGFTLNSVTPSAPENEVFNSPAVADQLYEHSVSPPDIVAKSTGYTVFYIDRTDPGRLAKISRTPVSIEQYNTLNQNSSYIGAVTNGIHGYIDTGITDGNKPRHYAGIALTDTTMGAVYDDHPADNVVQRVVHYA